MTEKSLAIEINGIIAATPTVSIRDIKTEKSIKNIKFFLSCFVNNENNLFKNNFKFYLLEYRDEI